MVRREQLQLLLCLQVQGKLERHQQGPGRVLLLLLLLLFLLTGRVKPQHLQAQGMVMGRSLHLCLLLCRHLHWGRGCYL
jgi:putative effector of murein hydrolase LrgA (UPF0299 family)